jgi:magnesium-transporting ATPase (P-type)
MQSKVEDEEERLKERIRSDRMTILVALPRYRSVSAVAILSLHALATLILGVIVFSNPFPYPVMYVLFGITTWIFVALRFLAQGLKRKFSELVLLVFDCLLLAFFVYVILDQVRSRKVAVGEAVVREDLPVLYLPALLYCTVILALLIHAVFSKPRKMV